MEIEGLIIRQTPFQDNDMMITLLSEERIYSFLARGVMKIDSKNAASVNLFTYGRYTLMSGKNGKTLKNSEILNSFPNTRKEFAGLATLDYLSEVTNKLISKDKASEFYPYLLKTLELLNSGFDPNTLNLIYLAATLRISGYGLDVSECVICNKTSQINAISYKDGGFICTDCFNPLNHLKCTVRKLKIIRYLFKVSPDKMDSGELEKEEAKEIMNELLGFASDNADLYLKSAKLLKTF